MNRRDFLALTSALPLAAATASGQTTEVKPKPAPPKPVKAPTPQIPPLEPIPGPPCLIAGPMLGHIGDTEASLWLRGSQPTEWSVQFSEQPDFTNAKVVKGTALVEATACGSQLRLENLRPATRYFYRVAFGDRIVSVMPAASFTTAPVVGTAGKQRIGFSSCVGRLPQNTAAAWGEISSRQNFDLFLMLGDNHYGDSNQIDRQRLYYTAHRADPGFRDFSAKLPVYGIWDDHDFGKNNGDNTNAGKESSLQAFREFWPNPKRTEEPADPAIYYHFQRGEVGFFMLDVRWHRSPNKTPDSAEKTMLGATQIAWLKRALKASTAKVKLIASGSEWQTHSSDDSWAQFLTERNALLDWIDAEKISGVILLSGDRHFCGGYQIRDRFIELTSGPLGSVGPKELKSVVSQETFTAFVDRKMWFILEIDTTTKPQPAVAYEVWGAGVGLLERRDFRWEEVQGIAKIQPSEPIANLRSGKS